MSKTLIEIVTPSVGESVTEASLAEWLKNKGEMVEKDEAVLALETDKAAQELVAPQAGLLVETLFKEGDTVTPGDVLARIDVSVKPDQSKPDPSPTHEQESQIQTASSEKILMPAAKRIIDENNLDVSNIKGHGKKGRITKQDAVQALNDASSYQGKPKEYKRTLENREERIRMSRLRQTIARRLKEAQNTAAILTTFNEVDLSAIIKLRSDNKELFLKKHNVKLGFMSFFVKASLHALKELPTVNAEIDGTDIIYKNYYDIGVAVGTDKGLVVPVIRDADQRSFANIEQEIALLGKKARDGKLTVEEMQGASFTLSNGGVYGSLMSTPILNPPQSGILGMHKIQQRPVVLENRKIEARPMMYLALSYDHRIVDGKEAVTFLVRIKESLETPERLLLDL